MIRVKETFVRGSVEGKLTVRESMEGKLTVGENMELPVRARSALWVISFLRLKQNMQLILGS